MALAELTGGGLPRLIVASYDKRAYALDGDGNTYWQVVTRGPVYAVETADLDRDGWDETALGGDDNSVYLIGADGTGRWEYRASSRITALAAADLTGDGIPAIVAGVWDGGVLALDSTGHLDWQVPIGGEPTQIRAADLDGDGADEVVVATGAGALAVLRGDGRGLWEVSLDGYVYRLALADLTGDGREEVVAATGAGTLWAFSSNGAENWRVPVEASVTALAVADLDGDAAPEILAGTGPAPGWVVAVAAGGDRLWQVELPGGVWALAAADLDRDGAVEVVAGADDGRLALLDQYGRRCGAYATPARVHGIVPADVDGDGRLELLVRSGDFIYSLAADPVGETGESRPPEPETLAVAPEGFLPPIDPDEVELVAVGDVMLSRSIAERAGPLGPSYPFAATASLLQRADVAALNLECVLSTSGAPASKSFVLRAHPRMVDGLSKAGVDVVWLSNNHVLDYGPEALFDTLTVLDARGIRHTGAGRDLPSALAPAVLEVKGLRIAFLAFTDAAPGPWYAGPGSPGVAMAETARVRTAVEQARQQADLVVVALHAGYEYSTVSNATQQQVARAAIDAGAVLVIGHGPHVLQGTEAYGGGFVAYSLGNFVFDIDVVDKAQDGAILRVVLGREGVRRVDLLPTRIVADVQPRLLAGPDGYPVIQPLLSQPSASCGTAPVLSPPAGERPHYDLDVSLDYAGHDIEVVEVISITNHTADAWDEVVLSAPPAYWPGLFDLHTVEMVVDGDATVVSPVLANTMMHVRLPAPLLPGERVGLRLEFTLQLPRLDPAGWPPAGNFGWGEGVVQVGDWYPALVPYREGLGWLTWDYHPVGDPTINELGTYDVRISTGREVVIAGPGLSSHEGSVWRFHLSQARSFAFLASLEYRVLGRSTGEVTVRSYYLPGYEEAGRAALDTAIEAIRLFADLFGPYPYPELVVAQNGYYGAMEYSAFMMLSAYAYETYDGEPASLLVALTAHEVSHQWWYGAVGSDQVHEPWLDESLAMYSELLFYERLHPEFVDWWWDFRVDRWGPGGWVDASIYDYDDTRTYVHTMYGRAAHFIADLRSTMGDPAFFSFLRDYYASGRGRMVTACDFFRQVRAHTGVDIGPLLARYFAAER